MMIVMKLYGVKVCGFVGCWMVMVCVVVDF